MNNGANDANVTSNGANHMGMGMGIAFVNFIGRVRDVKPAPTGRNEDLKLVRIKVYIYFLRNHLILFRIWNII